ncbi:hypothetical protein COLU111180_19930 [Cohnella lubricantis]|nr:hypothetical protein [Cohnella lubricantis]
MMRSFKGQSVLCRRFGVRRFFAYGKVTKVGEVPHYQISGQIRQNEGSKRS